MLLLSTRWTVSFGQFTLNGALKTEELDTCLSAVASAFAIPEHPDKEMKLAAPCGLYDPSGPVISHSFLDADGNTWLGVGTRLVANTPNPALVEAEFRRVAEMEFGSAWNETKKKRLNGLRFRIKAEMAAKTPFRLGETGALFICIQNGALVSVGHSGMLVAKDLVGRTSVITNSKFRSSSDEFKGPLLAILRNQGASELPWPTGTASLKRRRGDVNETASVKRLGWGTDSQDATDLLNQGWRPIKIEVDWGDHRSAIVDLTGSMASVRWPSKITLPDPSGVVEHRLGQLLAMDARVRGMFVAAIGSALPLEDEATVGEALPAEA